MEGSDPMKIERINDNQIRCTLTSFDLSVRNLNLSELAYGSEKARNLFREMIQKASNEVGFEAEDIPLMVEAIPLSDESVMLVITKIEDPEELDTRFSKFSQLSEDERSSFLNELTNEFLEGADDLLSLLNSDTEKTEQADTKLEELDSSDEEESSKPAAPLTRIYKFANLDQTADAAQVVGHVFQGGSTLYKRPDSHEYYLVVSNQGSEALEYSRVCNILAEYGTKVKQETGTEAYFREHYETMIATQALQKLTYL